MSLNNYDCISVIVTTFNDEATILPVLKSLLLAGFPLSDLQLIIVDGGSTDNTVNIIYEFLNKYGNLFKDVILIQHKKNLGVSKARNDGIKIAQCKYTLILDSDVILPPNSLKEMIRYLTLTHNINSKVIGVKAMLDTAFPLYMKLSYGKIHKRTIAATENLLIYTDIIKKFQYNEELGPPYSSDEDIELGARLLKNGLKIHSLNYIICNHLKPDTSLYITKSKSIIDKIKKSIIIIKSYFTKYVQKGFYTFFKSLPIIDKIFYIIYFSIVFILLPIFILSIFVLHVITINIFILIIGFILSGFIYEVLIDLSGLFDLRKVHLFIAYYMLIIINRSLRFASMIWYIFITKIDAKLRR
jgi:glycosyltransferase involved in cell wall biosynthesis